jgi:hypothetical protein
MAFVEVVVGILAVWRVTHLLQAEDGPWNLSVRLRRAAGEGFWAGLLDCFYCLTLWVSAPVTLLVAAGWREAVVLWVGLSGGTILLERMMPSEVDYREDL